eukprot:604345-Alexandrium_andersonii.AAC.1
MHASCECACACKILSGVHAVNVLSAKCPLASPRAAPNAQRLMHQMVSGSLVRLNMHGAAVCASSRC